MKDKGTLEQNSNNPQVISPERKQYLKIIRQRKIRIWITQLCILVVFIVSWEILANLGKIDSFIASQPSRIWKTFANLSSNHLVIFLVVKSHFVK